MKTLVIIPAYNEEATIGILLDELMRYIKKEDILVIDDGSYDRTYDITKKKGVRILKNRKNLGKGMSQRIGYLYAIVNSYDAVITMDADLQHNPEDIERLLKYPLNSNEIIIGSRFTELYKMPKDRYLSNRLTTLSLSVLLKKRLEDTQCGYRRIPVSILRSIQLETSRYQTESELLVKAVIKGAKLRYVPIQAIYGDEGSSINRFIDTMRFLRMYIKFLWHII